MHKSMTILVVAITVAMSVPAFAELQNVQVGGQIEFRGRWYHQAFETGRPTPQLRILQQHLPNRPIGVPAWPAIAPPVGVLSWMRYDDQGNDWHFYERATSLNVAADFTDNVKAFIEFYDFDKWGTDFRSNYLTGIDGAADTGDDVEVLQAYVDMDELFGAPLRLRIGRQVMQFRRDLDCFLLGGKTSPTQRFSYDGVRATYKATEDLTLDAWWMKLEERSPGEEDGDTDFYGLYGTYSGIEPLSISAYWLYIRDAQKVNDTNNTWIGERVEDILGIDDYPITQIHTVGLRFFGKSNQFDYNLEVAYQFGDAGKLGQMFQLPMWALSNVMYGDDDAEYDNMALDATLGYTFDTAWHIRPYISGCYFEGEDNRDISFWDWVNPFQRPEASVSFNRLFGDKNYCPVLNDNADMTNYWQVGGGVTMAPTEKLAWIVRAYNTWVDETFDWPAYLSVPKTRWWIPTGRLLIAPPLSFWTKESDDNLGFSVDTILKYSYNSNLTFLLYYGHLFPGDGVRDGAYINWYGNMMNGGIDDNGADYVFWWTILKF